MLLDDRAGQPVPRFTSLVVSVRCRIRSNTADPDQGVGVILKPEVSLLRCHALVSFRGVRSVGSVVSLPGPGLVPFTFQVPRFSTRVPVHRGDGGCGLTLQLCTYNCIGDI